MLVDNAENNKVSIIGIGRLGLCFALTLEKSGYDVLGCDVHQGYVDEINNKTVKSSECGVEEFLNRSSNFKATTSLKETIDHSNMLFIMVATPSLESGRYDHSQIDNLVEEVKKLGVQEEKKHFVISCTPMPGYCDTVQQELESYNYVVSYNPEFIAQGTILRDQSEPDMVLIGEGSEEAGDRIQEIYEHHTISDPKFCRMTRIESEICKISLNCYVTTKISFANMIGDIVKKSGGNPHTVLGAIGSDSRVGSKYLGYGYGYGGPCFPRDNRALGIYAQDIDMAADISLATDKINEKHLIFQVSEFISNHSSAEPVFFESITYKPGTTIIEESQQLAFAVEVAKAGYDVMIIEHRDTISQVRDLYGDLFTYEEKR
jgi:nucleotide sugar dehydrogenase